MWGLLVGKPAIQRVKRADRTACRSIASPPGVDRMALIVSCLVIGLLFLLAGLAPRTGRRNRALSGLPRGCQDAERRFVQAVEANDFDRAETELQTILDRR
jgi:hypothetical protein